VVYEQNSVDSKDMLIKTSVCVRTALLKRVFFRSKESSLPFKSYIGGYYSCVCNTFRSVCSLFSVLNYSVLVVQCLQIFTSIPHNLQISITRTDTSYKDYKISIGI